MFSRLARCEGECTSGRVVRVLTIRNRRLLSTQLLSILLYRRRLFLHGTATFKGMQRGQKRLQCRGRPNKARLQDIRIRGQGGDKPGRHPLTSNYKTCNLHYNRHRLQVRQRPYQISFEERESIPNSSNRYSNNPSSSRRCVPKCELLTIRRTSSPLNTTSQANSRSRRLRHVTLCQYNYYINGVQLCQKLRAILLSSYCSVNDQHNLRRDSSRKRSGIHKTS